MYPTRNLFTAEEAFTRLGQNRESGCLVVVSSQATTRIFTRDATVVHAMSEGEEGPEVLQKAFADHEASYVWLPGAKPFREIMGVNICGHVLEMAIAKDIHLSRTAKVSLNSFDQSTVPRNKRWAGLYLVAVNRPEEKIPLNKSAVVVGRDESSDIILAHPSVSRRHCLLQLSARGLGFKDLESANGVYINGIRAKDGLLHASDRITLGAYELRLEKEAK